MLSPFLMFNVNFMHIGVLIKLEARAADYDFL
jgi:hypothetical protein